MMSFFAFANDEFFAFANDECITKLHTVNKNEDGEAKKPFLKMSPNLSIHLITVWDGQF